MSSVISRSKDYAVILPYVSRILPLVDQELARWRSKALIIPDEELKKQALASITNKRFHCQGGSIYALYTPLQAEKLVRFIVALQTISDYLDNLCDRVAGASEESFRQLHQAMLAAVDLSVQKQDWYGSYPYQNDGGYLDGLINVSRQALTELPGYKSICAELVKLVHLYIDLQVYKHIEEKERVEKLVKWFSAYRHWDIYWWEFSAACGSTLALFLLAAMAAAGPVPDMEIKSLLSCYFPWLCGLHILLDYFIDLDEDKKHHDLNFVSYYPSQLVAEKGLLRFLEEAKKGAANLPRPAFHRLVIMGLLALYLSDPKACTAERSPLAQKLLQAGGQTACWLHRLCVLLRRMGRI
ncbi:MAG: tetraprenyl-beta-curcumene synthase family protein [Firmicutes bacterium]|nr:tetraprenyl-beta-curcumene synthase family protein [Bacillota bacterium]